MPSMPTTEELTTESNGTPLVSHSNSSANLVQTALPQQNSGSVRTIHFCPEFLRAMESVSYIAECTRRSEEENEVNPMFNCLSHAFEMTGEVLQKCFTLRLTIVFRDIDCIQV